MIANTKLSITMLISLVCVVGSANGMNWTGKEKIRYMLDKDKKVIGCMSAGIKPSDEFENLKGKKILEISPFSGLLEHQKELLQATFLSARTSEKAAEVLFTLFETIEQKIKISPFCCSQDEVYFVLRMSLKRVGQAPAPQCAGTPDIDAHISTKVKKGETLDDCMWGSSNHLPPAPDDWLE